MLKYNFESRSTIAIFFATLKTWVESVFFKSTLFGESKLVKSKVILGKYSQYWHSYSCDIENNYHVTNITNDSVSAGIRNQIFLPMARNSDGHYEVDETFITGNEQVKCDAEFTSRVYDKVSINIHNKIWTFSLQTCNHDWLEKFV